MVLYLSNSACQADASSGGTTPVTGFHSTIDRPEPVSRVAPPTTKVTNINAATSHSHSRTARARLGELATTSVMAVFASGGADHIVGRSLPQSRVNAMPLRLRKLIGGFALIILVVTWALVAMALAQALAIKGNGAVEV